MAVVVAGDPADPRALPLLPALLRGRASRRPASRAEAACRRARGRARGGASARPRRSTSTSTRCRLVPANIAWGVGARRGCGHRASAGRPDRPVAARSSRCRLAAVVRLGRRSSSAARTSSCPTPGRRRAASAVPALGVGVAVTVAGDRARDERRRRADRPATLLGWAFATLAGWGLVASWFVASRRLAPARRPATGSSEPLARSAPPGRRCSLLAAPGRLGRPRAGR